MAVTDDLDRDVRVAVYRHFAATAAAPRASHVGSALGLA
jgi:hypothetical protein